MRAENPFAPASFFRLLIIFLNTKTSFPYVEESDDALSPKANQSIPRLRELTGLSNRLAVQGYASGRPLVCLAVCMASHVRAFACVCLFAVKDIRLLEKRSGT